MSIVTGGWGTGAISTQGWGTSGEVVIPVPPVPPVPTYDELRLDIIERLLNIIQEGIMRPDLATKIELKEVVDEYQQPLINLDITLEDLEQRIKNLQKSIQESNKKKN